MNLTTNPKYTNLPFHCLVKCGQSCLSDIETGDTQLVLMHDACMLWFSLAVGEIPMMVPEYTCWCTYSSKSFG